MSVSNSNLRLPFLPWEVHSRIYDFLQDTRSRGAYKTASRDFNIIFKYSDPHLSKVERFIQENYEVLGSFPAKVEIKRFFFSFPYIVGAGDTHTEPAHELLNALLANSLGLNNTQYFIEGGKAALEYWKENRLGIVQYFKPEIVAIVKTWDLDREKNKFATENLYARLDISQVNMYITQQLFHLYSDQDQWTVDKFCTFMEKRFAQETVEDFWSEMSFKFCSQASFLSSGNIKEQFKAAENISSTYKEYVMETLKWWIIAYMIENNQYNSPVFQAQCDLIDQWRDEGLQSHVLDTLKSNQSGFFFAGECHISNLHLFCKKLRLRYLCLRPYDGVSMQSVEASHKRIFVQDIPPASSGAPAIKIEETVHSTQIEEGGSHQEELVQSLDFQAQIQRLLAFDVHDMDCGVNHYGLWNSRVRELLFLELDRSTKKLSSLGEKLRSPSLTKEVDGDAEKNSTEMEIIDQALKETLGPNQIEIIKEYLSTF